MKGGVLVSGEDDSYFSPCFSFILLVIFTCFDKRFCNQLLAKYILQTTDMLTCYILCSLWLHFQSELVTTLLLSP